MHHVRTRCNSLNQGTLVANNSNEPTAEVEAAAVVQAEANSQESASHPESIVLHGQGEVVPALIGPHNPLPVSGHVVLATSMPPVLVPAPTPPAAPVLNVDLDVNMNVDPNLDLAHTALMGSLNGIGEVQVAENQVPENLAAVVPAGQNVQEPTILLEHAMPNQPAFPDAPFVQPFVPAQAMPAVVAQPFAPVANDNPAQQPLLRSLHGFQGIQFGDESEDEED